MILQKPKLTLAMLALVLLITSCNNSTTKKGATQDDANKGITADEQAITPAKSKYHTKKELAGFFVHHQDGNIEQVQPKEVTAENIGTYCYFYIKGKRTFSLKLHINYPQHTANIFELEVDGEVLKYQANKNHTTEQTSTIAEGSTFVWYDKTVNEEDETFIRKMGAANGANLKLKYKEESKDDSKDKSKGESKEESKEVEVATIRLTKEECQSMVRAIDYYKSLDGANIPKKGMVNIRG